MDSGWPSDGLTTGLDRPVRESTEGGACPRPSGENDAGPLRLLLVEDQDADAELTRDMFEEGAIDVEWRQVGLMADIDFATIAEWADCALVDLSLPDSRGVETVKELLRLAPSLPIVVLSGNTDRALALSAVQHGAQDYLMKGRADAELLTRTVGYAIERNRSGRKALEGRQHERLGLLAGGVAHEFNNLHAGILGYAEFVADYLSSDATNSGPARQQAREDLEQIRHATERAAGLTRKLLTFTEQDFVRPEVIDINEVIDGSKHLLTSSLGGQIELILDYGHDLGPILADRAHITQMLGHLADNARDAMPAGGRLTIETLEIADARGGGLPSGLTVAVRVGDTGAGIAQDIVARVFDPFYSTKPVGKGPGLGLAAVHGIMSRWGGRVDIASQPSVGTTLTLLFPVTERVPEKALRPTGGPGPNVLVVDGD